MQTKKITGVVTNADGSSAPFSGTIDVAGIPVITSVSVTPSRAPAGTSRTITVTATDPEGLPLTYRCFVDGVELKQTEKAGEFVWNG